MSYLLLIEAFPVQHNIKNEHLTGKVLDKVDERVECHVVQALFRQSHTVLLLRLLSAELTAPELELIKQIVQRVVAELEWRALLEADCVRCKGKLDR